MFKRLSSIALVCLIVMYGGISSVFAIDFSQAFGRAKERMLDIKDIFGGGATVTNLYTQSLKLVKDHEVRATATAFDEMMVYYDMCPRIQNEDFMNILYTSNPSFATTFLTIFDESNKKVVAPSPEVIDKSYQMFFSCKGIKNPLAPDYAALNNEINRIYYELYIDGYRKQTLNQDNFGSDFFWNGSLDDSDFDVLYDIAQVGKVLFEQFQESPEILFYRLPSAVGGGSSSSASSAYQVGSVGGSSPGGSSSPVGGTQQTGGTDVPGDVPGRSPPGTGFDVGGEDFFPQSVLPSDDRVVDIDNDRSLQNFIASTRDVSPSSPIGALLLGNQCLTEEVIELIEEDIPEPTMTPEAYIAAIKDFVDTANTNTLVLDGLKETFTERLNTTPGIPDPSDPSYASAVANLYAEQAFGEAPVGSCEYVCNTLPLDKQVPCQMKCAQSCIQQCDGLSLQDKALCVSDCLCFLITGPQGKGREGVEDMFRIKFCKVPVQNKRVERRTKLYSIQAIFQEISDVLQGLRDSGQMVKFSQKKEFLDGSIKINLADNFAFKLQIGFKPLFPQRSAALKEKKLTEHNSDVGLFILTMNTQNVSADDYKKYIVIADVDKNQAMMEPVNSLVDIEKNLAITKIARASAVEPNTLPPDMFKAILASYSHQTTVLFVENMMDFLQDNQFFWYSMTNELLDITKMSLELQKKIETSK